MNEWMHVSLGQATQVDVLLNLFQQFRVSARIRGGDIAAWNSFLCGSAPSTGALSISDRHPGGSGQALTPSTFNIN